ncbi:hypothetical protein CEXT_161701 [Caerostris extrusa]|uniref:LAGLIDADG homing endonuclease n=1 Tax=Caerostris extrusa TaxID=172846 RepID=A0AAV4XXH3_CAEEX|nr:hypothetical protein CEXT_161701 [Caerostris extrusa]
MYIRGVIDKKTEKKKKKKKEACLLRITSFRPKRITCPQGDKGVERNSELPRSLELSSTLTHELPCSLELLLILVQEYGYLDLHIPKKGIKYISSDRTFMDKFYTFACRVYENIHDTKDGRQDDRHE